VDANEDEETNENEHEGKKEKKEKRQKRVRVEQPKFAKQAREGVGRCYRSGNEGPLFSLKGNGEKRVRGRRDEGEGRKKSTKREEGGHRVYYWREPRPLNKDKAAFDDYAVSICVFV
jgi:hypothetical protein